MNTLKYHMYAVLERLLIVIAELLLNSIIMHWAESLYYKQYVMWLETQDMHALATGHPTDQEINDMTYSHCSLCSTLLDGAITMNNNGAWFCSETCLREYTILEMSQHYGCEGNCFTCHKVACPDYPTSLRCKGDLCRGCSLNTCINHISVYTNPYYGAYAYTLMLHCLGCGRSQEHNIDRSAYSALRECKHCTVCNRVVIDNNTIYTVHIDCLCNDSCSIEYYGCQGASVPADFIADYYEGKHRHNMPIWPYAPCYDKVGDFKCNKSLCTSAYCCSLRVAS